MGTVSTVLKLMIGTVAIVGAVAGGAYYSGSIREPTAGVQDIGDWGEVSDERTEIITSVWVNNPNQVGVSIDGNLQVSYQLYLNGVNLAEGSKEGISVPPGNNTVEISTEVKNQQLPAWWVSFVNNNETITVRAVPSATVSAGPFTGSPELLTVNRTMLSDSTPVSSALSQTASAAEGEYTKTITEDELQSQLDQGLVNAENIERLRSDSSSEEVTVGYEVREGSARFGDVTEETTTVHFRFLLHNPSETVCMPAEPDNVGVTVEMNDNEMFNAQGEDTSIESIGRSSNQSGTECIDRALIPPQDTKEVVYSVQMDNDKIDDWFTSHARQEEQTEVRVELQYVFSVGETTFRLPEDSPAEYTCEFQTGILVDNQKTDTNCGQAESIEGVETTQTTSAENSSGSDTEETSTETEHTPVETDTSTSTSTPTPEQEPPRAVAQANTTEGEAPLTVSFDASKSTDPNGDISRYVWRFKDGSSPVEGETVIHTFRTTGEYEVELVVFDSSGNQNSTMVTITVNSRLG